MQRGSVPSWPSYFLKPPSALAASGDPVARPPGCALLAFEGEVALVIGRRASRVERGAAWDHVGWVTAANDFAVYDLRYADRGGNVRSKGIDGLTPLGPRLLDARTVDMVADLVGPDVKFHHCKINLKLSGAKTEVSYHQDFAFAAGAGQVTDLRERLGRAFDQHLLLPQDLFHPKRHALPSRVENHEGALAGALCPRRFAGKFQNIFELHESDSPSAQLDRFPVLDRPNVLGTRARGPLDRGSRQNEDLLRSTHQDPAGSSQGYRE